MVHALKDVDPHVRKNAAESLSHYPLGAHESVPPLLELLYDTHDEVRSAAIVSLAKLGRGSKDVEIALRNIADDPQDAETLRAAAALAHLGKAEESVIPQLFAAMSVDDPWVSDVAMKGLISLSAKAPDQITERSLAAVTEAKAPAATNSLKLLRLVGRKHPMPVERLAAAYDNLSGEDRKLLVETVIALDPQRKQSHALILKANEDPDPSMKIVVMAALAQMGDMTPEEKRLLLDGLSDPNAEVRLAALKIVTERRIALNDASERLTALTDDPDPRIRPLAVAALGSLTPPPVNTLSVLSASLHDKSKDVRGAAVLSLRNFAKHKPQESIDLLTSALKTEEDVRLKEYIAEALYGLGIKTHITPVSAAQKGKELVPGWDLTRD